MFKLAKFDKLFLGEDQENRIIDEDSSDRKFHIPGVSQVVKSRREETHIFYPIEKASML